MEPPLATCTSFAEPTHPPGLRIPIRSSRQRSDEFGPGTPNGAVDVRRVSPDDLARRQQSSRTLLAATTPHLEWISALLGDVEHAVFLVDADGIIIGSVGTWTRFDDSAVALGCDWSEAAMGTNAAGTALATDQPVALVGPERLGLPFRTCTSTAAPIHALDGHVAAAITISTPTDHAGPSRLLIAAHSALVVEQAIRASAQVERAESLRLLALLSSFTAHELVNPLSALKTVLDILARNQLQGEAAKMVAAACGSADRLLQVVEELRILGGSHDRRLRRTDLRTLVRSSVARIDPEARIGVDTVLPDDECHVACNSPLLSRALHNLLDNARHAVGEHGQMGICVEPWVNAVRITVWDTGPGISLADRDKLFQESFTTKPGGSGLGLLLSRVIIEHVHGGQLRYRENQPIGSRFEVELPSNPLSGQTNDSTKFRR